MLCRMLRPFGDIQDHAGNRGAGPTPVSINRNQEGLTTLKLQSIIKCPKCGKEKTEIMPVDTCLIRYKCTHCGETLLPKKGDCCVFCSYGSERCPSKQPKA